MDQFLVDAESILHTALSALASGHTPTDMIILTGVGGHIQMFSECDWPLGSIRVERGAAAAYRITCRQGRVIVDGNQHGRSCRLEQAIAHLQNRQHLLSQGIHCWMQADHVASKAFLMAPPAR